MAFPLPISNKNFVGYTASRLCNDSIKPFKLFPKILLNNSFSKSELSFHASFVKSDFRLHLLIKHRPIEVRACYT